MAMYGQQWSAALTFMYRTYLEALKFSCSQSNKARRRMFAPVAFERHIFLTVDLKRDQLETRVATLDLMLVTARARPKPDEHEIAKLEQDLKIAKAALEEYDGEHPRN